MFKQLRNNKKAQNTAEYALLIALVIAGVIAMQTYAQRSLQARMRDAGAFMTQQTNEMGMSNQYEPYYLNSSYDVSRNSTSNKRLDSRTTAYDSNTARVRAANGYEKSDYDTTVFTNKI